MTIPNQWHRLTTSQLLPMMEHPATSAADRETIAEILEARRVVRLRSPRRFQ
jgi:hypothetical protein